MKTNQLYVHTKQDLVKRRNQEKRRKNNIFLIVIAVLLFASSATNFVLTSIGIIYVVVVIIFWDKRPWLKRVTYEDIGNLEVEYELAMQIQEHKDHIKKDYSLTNDLYQTLDPINIEIQIKTKKEIVSLGENILNLIEQVFCLEDTLESGQSSELLIMRQELKQEVECAKLHIEQLKKQV